MRLFVALPVPEPRRAALVAAVETLRAASPRARWERVEKLHLTLVFLGEVDRERTVALADRLRATVAELPALELRLSGAGCFPTPERARVLWVGVEGADALFELQAAVAATCEPFVERPERRPFHPHLTLARCDPPWRAAEVDRFVRRLAGVAGEPFPAREFHLVESELAPGGSRYREVSRLGLDGGAG